MNGKGLSEDILSREKDDLRVLVGVEAQIDFSLVAVDIKSRSL
jgi:hypothetical protein